MFIARQIYMYYVLSLSSKLKNCHEYAQQNIWQLYFPHQGRKIKQHIENSKHQGIWNIYKPINNLCTCTCEFAYSQKLSFPVFFQIWYGRNQLYFFSMNIFNALSCDFHLFSVRDDDAEFETDRKVEPWDV